MTKLRDAHTSRGAALLLIVIFLVAASAYATAQSSDAPAKDAASQLATRPDERTTHAAVREGGLRAAARLHGGTYVARRDPSWWGAFDVDTLVKRSTLIVSGTALSSVCRLSNDGSYITTDYEVRVEDFLKGHGRLRAVGGADGSDANLVTVKLMGGYLKFDDGTAAVELTPGFKKMEVGKKYVLFLTDGDTSKPGDLGDLTLTGGPQGLFEIDENSTIKPHARDFDVASKYKGTGSEDFQQQVREAVKKFKGETERCCTK